MAQCASVNFHESQRSIFKALICRVNCGLLSKDEEYRDLKDYWKKRLEGRKYDIVRFRNGYATNAPEMDVEFLGVDKRSDCYAIRLGKILSVKRWPPA